MAKFILIISLMISTQLMATTVQECAPKLEAARSSLLELVAGNKNPTQQNLVKNTADSANECFMALVAPAGKEKQIEELKTIWASFKHTREKQIVPLILSGNKDQGTDVAQGIQTLRMEKMRALIKAIDGK